MMSLCRSSCSRSLFVLFWMSSVVVLVESLVLRQSSSATTVDQVGARVAYSTKLYSSNRGEEEDETFIFDRSKSPLVKGQETNPSSTSSSTKNSEANYRYIEDLTPPTVNFKRDSILFSDNPSTQRSNSGLDLWKACKKNLPAVFTGAWPWRDPNVADNDPLAGFYNLAFVRLPVILVGVVYTKNLLEGHPLVVDFGDGPFAMNPLIIYAVLALVLA